MSAPPDRAPVGLFWRAGHPILVLDPDRDGIRYANHSACSLLGYTVDDLLATPASAIFRSDRLGLKAFLEAIDSQGEGWTTSFALLTKTGVLLPAELLALAVQGHEQRSVLVLADSRTGQVRGPFG